MLSVSAADPFLLDECVILPAEFGWEHSELRSDLIHFDTSIIGSVHSHPSPSTRPSSADLGFFSRMGKVHLILGHPYRESSFSAYDSGGRKIHLGIVDGPLFSAQH
mgnify:CR=1 FL=1